MIKAGECGKISNNIKFSSRTHSGGRIKSTTESFGT